MWFASAGTSVLWWLYIDHRLSGNDTLTKTTKDPREEAELRRDGKQTLLVYAVAATVFTVGGAAGLGLSLGSVPNKILWFQVILLLLMLFMRKRVALTIALFHVAGKVFIHLPLLTLQPFVTFLALLLFWIYWILVLLFLGTTGPFPFGSTQDTRVASR